MATDRGDVLQGTLDMLVLTALQLDPMHGWGITERIQQWSERVLQLGQGTLYPALYRLERRGLIRSEWKTTEHNRRARYYALTRQGRRQLTDELAQWQRMSRAVNLVIAATIYGASHAPIRGRLAASSRVVAGGHHRPAPHRGDRVPRRSADREEPPRRHDAV
jgi:transcriptional regulator